MEDFREVASVGLGIKDYKKHKFGQVITDLGTPTSDAQIAQQTVPNAVNPEFANTSDDDLVRDY